MGQRGAAGGIEDGERLCGACNVQVSLLVNVDKDGNDIGEQAKIVFAEWPVDKGRFADDVLARDKSPFTGVGTVSTVISHDKVFVRSYNAFIDGRKRVGWVIFIDVWFVQGYPIDGDSLSHDTDSITGNGDDALHVVQLWVERVFKHDYVSPLGCLKEIGGFIDEDVFLVVQGWFHAGSIYTKVLNREAQDKEHQ